MSIFGKKGGGDEELADDLAMDDQEFSDPALDEAALEASTEFPDAAGMDDLNAPASGFEGEDQEPLAATPRSLSSAAGGGRRNLLILVLLVVLAGLGGGYFYFMGDMGDTPAPVLVKANVPQPAPAKPAVPPKPATDAATGTMPQPLPGNAAAGDIVPPSNPFVAGDDPLAIDPAPGDPLADLETPPGAPPQPVAPQPAPLAQEDPLNLGAPLSEETAVAVPAETMMAGAGDTPVVTSAPDEVMPDLPPVAEATPGTVQGAAPAESPGQPEDLPMPVDAAAGQVAAVPQPKEETPSWAAPGNAEVPGTTNPLAKPTTPTDAELAIVQSAAVLDNVAPPKSAKEAAKEAKPGETKPTGAPFDPAGPKPGAEQALEKVGDLLEKPAIIRPIPSGYMIIRKESDAGNVDSRLTAARTALAQNRTTAAFELFDELKNDYPKDKRALMGRAVSLQKLGQHDEALAAYEDVLRSDPKNLDALTNMLGLLKAKDPMLAVDKLLELRNAYPYQGDITAQLGIAYGTVGQYDEALKYLEMADALKPGSTYVMYNKAVLFDKMGRSREAGTLYRQILRLAADGGLDQQLPLEAIRKRLATMR